MVKAFVVMFCIADVFLLWLLYVNREGPKTFETALTITIVMIGGLVIFITKSYEIKKDIDSVYFISNEKHEPAFFQDSSPFRMHFINDASLFARHFERNKQVHEESQSFVSFDGDKSLTDLLTVSILEHLSLCYSNHWYDELRIMRLPTCTTITKEKKEKPKFVEKDFMTYKKENLPKSLEQNMFFADFDPITKTITLPKGTKVSYQREGLPHGIELRFTKPLWFDIRLHVWRSSYTVGLGKLMAILVPDSVNDLTFESQYKRQNAFGTTVLRIDCKAQFNRWLAGNPSMIAYRQWTERLFDELYRVYDWVPFEKEIHQQEQLDVSQAILRMAK